MNDILNCEYKQVSEIALGVCGKAVNRLQESAITVFGLRRVKTQCWEKAS